MPPATTAKMTKIDTIKIIYRLEIYRYGEINCHCECQITHVTGGFLRKLISVQHRHNTHSSSVITLAHPPTRSSLKITNLSFQYAAPYLSDELSTELREPHQIQSPSHSPPIMHGSSSSPSSLSPLSSLTHSVFYTELKTCLIGKSFPP